MVAAPARRRQPSRVKNGRAQATYLVARERDWVLTRIAEKPDLTLRALLKELADRGLGCVDTYRIHRMMAARVTTAR